MIKQFKNSDVQTTPFTAIKSWKLLNVQHQDLVLLEHNSESPIGTETHVALEFIDYNFDAPFGVLNTECNIALEQQDSDPVIYEEGISGSGLFYSEDIKNITGTYKRLVYNKILRAYYNSYHNPLQIFGIDQIDFQLSGVKRHLSNYFRVFSLPSVNFGDRIEEGSITFVDNTFDDNYTVTDDKEGNLFAYPNLFSKSQEVRKISNIVQTGSSGYTCTGPIVSVPTAPTNLTASALSASGSYLLWTDNSSNESGFYIWRSIDSGSTWVYIGSTGENITSSYDLTLSPTSSYSYRVAAYNLLGTSSYSNTSSITTTT